MIQGPSFLPDDYVRDTREKRRGFASIALFAVVLGAVLAAFLVTNRQWTEIRTAQAEVNEATESAAGGIAEMRKLEAIRAQMMEKAELARGLLEPVPRSVLLACLVNTMPEAVSLLSLELVSEEIKPEKPAASETARGGDAKSRRSARSKEPAAPPKPEPIRRSVLVNVTGIAGDDIEVSRWMNELSRIPLLSSVRLETSEEQAVDGRAMRQFRISMRIAPDADAARWEGLRGLHASARRPAEEPGAGSAEASWQGPEDLGSDAPIGPDAGGTDQAKVTEEQP